MPSYTLNNRSPLPRTVHNDSADNSNALNGVAMDASAADRTVTVSFNGQTPRRASVAWQLTHSAATDVSIAAEVTLDGGNNWSPLVSRSIDGGDGTVSTYTDTKEVSGDDQAILQYELPAGCNGFRCVASATSGGSSDTLNAQIAFDDR